MKTNQKLQVKQSVSYSFTEDIDIVYKNFFQLIYQKMLNKNGLSYEIIDQEGVTADEINSEYTLMLKKINLKLKLVTVEKLDRGDFKSVTKKIVEVNNRSITSNLFVKYNFYANTFDNSTFFVIEIHYDIINDPFLAEYLLEVKEKEKISFMKQVEGLLHSLSRNRKNIESIVINRHIKQVWDYFSDTKTILHKLYGKKALITSTGENNQNFVVKTMKNFEIKYSLKKLHFTKEKVTILFEKAIKFNEENISKQSESFSIYRLSLMSCFVSIENVILYHVNGSYLNSLSGLHQNFLKKIKKRLEKMTCYFN